MKKIRINELARELEVTNGVILDMLPELGVHEKKTHSSSIDEDVAIIIRDRLTGSERPKTLEGRSLFSEGTEPSAHFEDTETKIAEPSGSLVADHVHEPAVKTAEPAAKPAPAAAHPQPADTVTGHAAPIEAAPTPAPTAAAPTSRSLPIRPPLASPGGMRPPAPSIPIPPRATIAHPPAAPRQATVAPPVPAPAAKPQPPAAVVTPPARAPHAAPGLPKSPPARPVAPPPAPPAPAASGTAAPRTPAQVPPTIQVTPGAAAAPSRPAPGSTVTRNMPLAPRPVAPGTPRPGQVVARPSGEGLRAGSSSPGGPRQAVPQVPRPPVAPQSPAATSAPSPHAGQPTRPPLVGQPAARPIVPPRPDLVARLTQSPQKAMPGQPTAPRPGSPMPGQPLYPGARRGAPGAPGARTGPGGRPMPAGPGGRPPLRGRGPHPTTPVLEPPPPTTEAGRRDAAKRRAQRTREIEEGRLRPVIRRQETELPVIDKEIAISEGITVKELSEKLGVRAALVIKVLLERKVLATINQTLDVKLAEELAKAFGATTSRMSYEQESVAEIAQTEVEGDLELRPPVVTIMGHVDHGKTSLLDAIREANVAAKEAGGITQHIGAYHVEINGRKIVFIDTPGHEAFTRMRSRGAKVTDIVVLVVAADDGVMPQTREAIDHARAAKVPIVVAVNKIDKPEAQPDRVMQQLTDLGLMPEAWGGDTPFVPVSAKQRQNLELLLEMILLVADMQELKANASRPAVATVLEAQVDRGRGPVATLLVRNGSLRVGDHYLCGTVFGRVRALFDDRGNQVKEVGPSMPAELIGLESLPEVGDTLQVVTDLAKARQIAEFREQKARDIAMAKTRVSLEQFHAQLREGETKELNLIIKADVGGSAEVLAETLQKLSNDKVQIRVLHAGVGAIRENDVNLASSSDAIIIGFNVRPERKAAELAELEKVDIRMHTIIYELTDEIRKAMVGMLEPVFKEVYKGRAEVRDTFRISKVGTIAGCYVQDGVISRDAEVRLLRDNVVVYTGRVDSLKRFKNDASEVKAGFECGIGLTNYNDVKQGDVIEAFVKEKVSQEGMI